MANYPIIPESLPTGFCPATYQDMLNEFSSHQSALIPDSSGRQWVFSATKPADTTVGWYQLDSLGRPIRPYIFAQGAWLYLHPSVPGLTQMWLGPLPNFSTFDGGDANPISALSGPMWELVAEMAGKFPVAAGTLTSGAVLAIGDTGGNDKATLTLATLPEHAHDCKATSQSGSGGSGHEFFQANETSKDPPDNPVTLTTELTGGDASGNATPFSIMPPYLTISWIRRTQRIYYAVV